MKITSTTCYLLDGQGMELHVRRLHPSWLRPVGGFWKILNEQGKRSTDYSVEIRLFASFDWGGAEAFSQPGQALERVAAGPAEIASWLKRDARRRQSACLYVLVSEDPARREEARNLGLTVLDFAELLRRLGLGAAMGAAELPKPKAPREPAILKGGKLMGEAELRWWREQLELPEEAEPDPQAVQAAEEQRLAHWLGAEADDPRVLEHGDEDWMTRNFPDQPGEGLPRRPPKSRPR